MNHWTISLTLLAPNCILIIISDVKSYFVSPLNWLVISCESQNTWIILAPIPLANRRPVINASYSASLFDAGKSRRNDCSKTLIVGDSSCTLTSDPCRDDAPSTCKVHFSAVRRSSLTSYGGSSTRKSAKT